MNKIVNFFKRNLKELLRDPLIYVFCLGFPIVMLLLFYVINKFTKGNTPTFEIPALLPSRHIGRRYGANEQCPIVRRVCRS